MSCWITCFENVTSAYTSLHDINLTCEKSFFEPLDRNNESETLKINFPVVLKSRAKLSSIRYTKTSNFGCNPIKLFYNQTV